MNAPMRRAGRSIAGGADIVALTSSVSHRQLLERVMPTLRVVHASVASAALKELYTTGASVLISRARDANGELVDHVVRQIHGIAPRLEIIVLTAGDQRDGRDVLALTGLGLAETVLNSDPTASARLRELVACALFAARRSELAERAAAGMEPAAARAVRYAFAHGDRFNTPSGLRAFVGLGEEALHARLRAQVGLTVEPLLMLGRLTAAILRMESSLMVRERVANELEFSSPSGMHNLFRRYTGMKAIEIVRRGGSQWMLDTLRARALPIQLQVDSG